MGDLVLTRKPGQTIYIGDDIQIRVQDIQGKQATISINAPISIPVHREEIYNEILAKREGKQNGN